MTENLNVHEEQKHPTKQDLNSVNQSNQIINDDPLTETMTDEQIERSLSVKITDEEKAEEKLAAEEVTAVEKEQEEFDDPTISKDPTDEKLK